MRRTILLSLLLICGPYSLAQTTQATEVTSLVTQLSSTVWKDREIAQETLIQRGPTVVPALQEALKTDLPQEARHRVETILVLIDERMETGPTLLNLKLENVTAREFVTEVNKQLRAELLPHTPEMWDQLRGNTQSFDYQNATYWDMLRDLQEKYNLELTQVNEGQMRLIQGGGGRFLNGPASVSGPFMIVAQQVHRSQTIDLTTKGAVGPARSDFNIQFMGMAEPKLRLLSPSMEVRLESAVDDKGNDLAPSGPNANYGGYGGSGPVWNFSTRLNYPQNAGTRIALLKGSIGLLLQTGSESFEIPDPMNAKNVEKTIGELRITFKEMTANGTNNYNVKIAIAYDQNRQDIAMRVHSLFNSANSAMKLTDAQGRRFYCSGRGTNQSNGAIEATLNFSPDPSTRIRRQRNTPQESNPPTQFQFQVPTSTKMISVPFEFKDLPIP